MNQEALDKTKTKYVSLATVSIVLLLSAALVVPSLAYAESDHHEKKNSKDKHDRSHEKNRKDKDDNHDKDDHHKHCEHQDNEKYKHHCDE